MTTLEDFEIPGIKPEKKQYAIKIIEKSKLSDERKKKKMEAELQIHMRLNHKNIVQFKHFFEDDKNIYILMELCEKRSL